MVTVRPEGGKTGGEIKKLGAHVILDDATAGLIDTEEAGELNADLVLVGREEEIANHLGSAKADGRLRIQHASQTIAMDESPSKAFRSKKDSSMRVAIDLVKSGAASALRECR